MILLMRIPFEEDGSATARGLAATAVGAGGGAAST
jgi:hypothetical protein